MPELHESWDRLAGDVRSHGLRNSLLIAIAPTATIASIQGCYESIEPQVANYFKRETLSGEFLQVNRYLISDLKRDGLWTPEIRSKIVAAEGSIQAIEKIPGRDSRALQDGVGDLAEGADRHGRAPVRVHLPVAVTQPFHGGAHDREALLDVHVRMEAGREDDLLSAVAREDADQENDASRSVHRSRARFGVRDRGPRRRRCPCSLESPGTCEACQ